MILAFFTLIRPNYSSTSDEFSKIRLSYILFRNAIFINDCAFKMQELNLDEFVTHELDFQDINKAFDLLIQGKSLRCIIWMDK